VSGQVAIAVFPLGGRLGTGTAIPAGFNFRGTVAPFARFDDFVAQSTIVAAAFGGHKCTLITFADRLTNHGNHPPSYSRYFVHKKWPAYGPDLAIVTHNLLFRHAI
jgi:hypothetical protein